MNSLAAWFAAGVLLLGAMAAAADDRDDEMVCVPAEDGRSWVCGTRANPPPDRGAAVLPRRTASAPPPFLAAPSGAVAPLAPADRPARDAFPPAPDRDPPAAAAAVEVRQVADADADDTTVEPLPAQSSTTTTTIPPRDAPGASTTAPPPAPPPLLAAPRPRLAPYAPVGPVSAAPAPAVSAPVVAEPVATEPVVAEPVAAEPVAAEPVAAEPVAAEPVAAEPVAAEPVAAEPVVAEPVAAGPIATERIAAEPSATEPIAAEPVAAEAIATEPAAPPVDTPSVDDGEAFLALPADRATLQLARAARVGDLYATWQRMVADSDGALARGTAYIITLDAGGTPQALLLWSDFADAAAARAAWEALPGFPAGKPAAYARRIAPLQAEIRRSVPSR